LDITSAQVLAVKTSRSSLMTSWKTKNELRKIL
jgi:hypothetical protein